MPVINGGYLLTLHIVRRGLLQYSGLSDKCDFNWPTGAPTLVLSSSTLETSKALDGRQWGLIVSLVIRDANEC